MRIIALSAIPLLFGSLACSGDAEETPPQDRALGVPAVASSGNEQVVQPTEPGADPLTEAPNSIDGARTSEEAPNLSASNLAEQEPNATEGADASGTAAAEANEEPAQTDDAENPEVPPADIENAPAADIATSPGCGSSSPTQGLSISANGQSAPYEVTLPPNYDPNVAAPMVFAFHGRGRTHEQFRDVDAGQVQTEFGSRAIMVYVKSIAGNGWNAAEEVQPNIDIFEALYPQVLQDYCVNPTEVFAIGHSSGGFFSNILACRFPERFRGIGSVAGATQECSGQVPAILVHGTSDSVVGFDRGVASRDGYLAGNGCSQGTQPVGIDNCIAYQQCDEGLPVQWCEHTEPTYSDNNGPTNHGWPSFASRALSSFLFGLLQD